MKNATILQAIELGFDFDQFEDDSTHEEMMRSIIDFMSENYEKLYQKEDECEIVNHSQGQYVSYGDFSSSGDIMDFRAHWHKPADTKIFHSQFVDMDCDGKFFSMNLYYLVGETDYNKE